MRGLGEDGEYRENQDDRYLVATGNAKKVERPTPVPPRLTWSICLSGSCTRNSKKRWPASRRSKKALEEKEREAADYKDKYLRALADAENPRKRIRQQSEESARLQREGLLRDLLSIIDNLERAVAAARDGGNGKPIVEGVELVLRSMVDFLRGHGVTQLNAVGQPFDPLLHEAIDQVESAEHEPNTVVDEFVRGYQIGDRLLRPARVAVSRLPAPAGHSGSGSGGGHVENQ